MLTSSPSLDCAFAGCRPLATPCLFVVFFIFSKQLTASAYHASVILNKVKESILVPTHILVHLFVAFTLVVAGFFLHTVGFRESVDISELLQATERISILSKRTIWVKVLNLANTIRLGGERFVFFCLFLGRLENSHNVYDGRGTVVSFHAICQRKSNVPHDFAYFIRAEGINMCRPLELAFLGNVNKTVILIPTCIIVR